MFKSIRLVLISMIVSTMALADVFITEIADPNNSANSRFIELYNNGDSDVDLSTYKIRRYTNANADFTASSEKPLEGTITAGGFKILCKSSSAFDETFSDIATCDQQISSGGALDSNGDDKIEIIDGDGNTVDIYGIPGVDVNNSVGDSNFEDGRGARNSGVCSGNSSFDYSEWTIDNDQSSGNGSAVDAPSGYNPGSWAGSDYDCSGGAATCDDATACNDGAAGDCEYVNVGYGNLQWPYSTTVDAESDSETIFGQVWVDGVTGSGTGTDNGVVAELGYGSVGSTADDTWTWVSAYADGTTSGNNDQVAASLNITDAGTYNYTYRYRYDSSCWYYGYANDSGDDFLGTITVNALTTYDVTFNVNLSYETVDSNPSDVKVVVFGTSDALLTDGDGDGVYSVTVALTAGDHAYKFYNGWYENVNDLDCAVYSDYWNRSVTVVDGNLDLAAVCYGQCDDCAPGCIDANASNYSETANVDDGTCEYPAVDPDNLFFSEYAEGSGSHKYLEIYNAEDFDVDMGGYSLSSCSNGCQVCLDSDGLAISATSESNCTSNEGVWTLTDDWDYPNNVTFDAGTMVSSGDVFIVCDKDADDSITGACDYEFEYLSNGDDVFALTQMGSGTVLDIIGVVSDDPGSGWAVAGVSNATKDHTLVRKAAVTTGNALWLDNVDADTGEVLNAGSAGSDVDNSEWIVLDQNTWDNIGSHPHYTGCNDSTATNYDDSADINDGSCEYACDDVDEDNVCDDVDDCVGAFDECGVCNGTGPVEDFDCDGNLLVSVTFNVDMNEQTVDTEGYGLSLFMPSPYGYHSMTDEDGDGVWSVTLTLVAETTYSYKYKNGDAWENNFNDLGCGDGGSYGNRTFTSADADQSLDTVCFSSCSACVTCAYDGDTNADGIVNVSDVVMIVGWIIGNGDADLCVGDVNTDGVVNVSDVVMIVGWIIGERSVINDATNADVILSDNTISINANGHISGAQITLSHGPNFSIDLTDNAYIAEYMTSENVTKLVVVSNQSSLDHIATCKGSFNIESVIIVNSNQEIADVNILNLEPVELTLAGPNPFNPTTSLNVIVANDGYVSVNVYNIVGQHVATLLSGYMDANTSGYTVNWNASNLSSGVYLVRAETAGSISTQKLMLLK